MKNVKNKLSFTKYKSKILDIIKNVKGISGVYDLEKEFFSKKQIKSKKLNWTKVDKSIKVNSLKNKNIEIELFLQVNFDSNLKMINKELFEKFELFFAKEFKFNLTDLKLNIVNLKV